MLTKRDTFLRFFFFLLICATPGVRRGTDVLKALCLGAKAVGLGRPFLYAQTAYGEQGVIRAVRSESQPVSTMAKPSHTGLPACLILKLIKPFKAVR